MSALLAALWDAVFVLAIVGAGQFLCGHHRADKPAHQAPAPPQRR